MKRRRDSFYGYPRKENSQDACMYIIKSGIFYKVGLAENAVQRMRDLQTGNPVRLQLVYVSPTMSRYHAIMAERIAARYLKDTRVSGEWYLCSEKAAIAAVNAGYRREVPIPKARSVG